MNTSARIPAGDAPAGASLPDLPALIEWSREQPSRMGYFAVLYHHVGVAVDLAVAQGHFEHPDELMQLKDAFFERYAEAFVAFRDGQPTTAAWETSFHAASTNDLCVLQHLLLGINAHINYDLAIAVTSVVAPADMPAFRGDFEYMNVILASLVDCMAADLAVVFRPLGVINRLFRREDKLLVEQAMRVLRESAWRHALRLSMVTGREREATLAAMEREAKHFAELIIQRRSPTRLLMLAIRRMERGSVPQVIDDLLQR